jgi:small subunit ribosomal protein S11
MAKETNDEKTGIIYVYSTSNNTIAQITDLAGNTIGRVTGGLVTKQNRLKANPTTAMFIAKKLSEYAKEYEIKALYIRLKSKTGEVGKGPGAHAIVKTLTKEGYKIISISEVTHIPRGGPKKAGGRRGRRV